MTRPTVGFPALRWCWGCRNALAYDGYRCEDCERERERRWGERVLGITEDPDAELRDAVVRALKECGEDLA